MPGGHTVHLQVGGKLSKGQAWKHKAGNQLPGLTALHMSLHMPNWLTSCANKSPTEPIAPATNSLLKLNYANNLTSAR